MNQSFDPTIIIFAVLAVFIVWKLRSVLGTRTGQERPPSNPFTRRQQVDPTAPASPEMGRVIPLPGAPPQVAQAEADPNRWKSILSADASATAAAGLDDIAAADPAFSGREFLQGARSAYEMVVAAFAKGDRDALRGLLSKDVFEGFAAAIAAREGRGETVQHTFVALDRAVIEDAHLKNRTAQVSVLFESQQINAIRARDGSLAEEGSDVLGHVSDHWTFAREAGSPDPNWKLVATNAE